jgi:hypothetical protein
MPYPVSALSNKGAVSPVTCPCDLDHTWLDLLHKRVRMEEGDRGGLAESEQTHGKKKAKVCLDINRPSHGRTYLHLDSGLTAI